MAENPKALIPPPNSTTSPLSFLFSVTISQPKIKIPKILARSVRRTEEEDDDRRKCDQAKEKKKWRKPGHLIPKKVGSLLSNLFGNKKSHMGNYYCCKVQRNDNGDQSHRNFPTQIVKRVELNETLPFSYSIRKFDEDDKKQGIEIGEKPETERSPKAATLSNFLNKSASLRFIRGRRSKSRNRVDEIGSNGGSFRMMNRAPSMAANRDEQSSRILTSKQKAKMARSLRKMASRRIGGKEEDGEEELCKKRILMGERCRPLHFSGKLQYDKYGVLLPELIP